MIKPSDLTWDEVVRVGPGTTLLTVIPVVAVASARPRDTAICAALVIP